MSKRKVTPLISLENITFQYNKKSIIQDFSTTIKPGEKILLSGPSGSGKTTLLKLVGGILELDSGTINLDRNPIGKDRFSIFGYHFVDTDFFERMSIRDNILILPHLLGVEIDTTWYRHLIEIFKMGAYETTELSELSAGQRERVGIIRALVHKPQILLLDEPGSHLDEELESILINFLRDYHRDTGATILISSHGDFARDFFDTFFYFHEDYHISLERKQDSSR